MVNRPRLSITAGITSNVPLLFSKVNAYTDCLPCEVQHTDGVTKYSTRCTKRQFEIKRYSYRIVVVYLHHVTVAEHQRRSLTAVLVQTTSVAANIHKVTAMSTHDSGCTFSPPASDRMVYKIRRVAIVLR